jgi:hypothetical protein
VQEQPRAVAAPDRFLVGIVLGAVALIAIGILAVLLAGRQAPSGAVDPSSPVGVVQAYVEAVRAGDTERARSYLSQSAREQVDKANFPKPYLPPSPPERRVLIEPGEVTGDRARVKVTVSTFTARSEPFSTSTYHQDVDVRLVRENGQWRIATPVEPFPFLY